MRGLQPKSYRWEKRCGGSWRNCSRVSWEIDFGWKSGGVVEESGTVDFPPPLLPPLVLLPKFV